MPVPTLLISGTVGVGKSTVAAKLNDILAELEVPNAAVDLDALIAQWPPTSEWNSDLLFENLASIWPNYQAHGATHLILARVLEDRGELERYRTAVPDAAITVCRLTAPEPVRLRRLRGRMFPGPSLEWHLARTVELEHILGRRSCEDFVVDNGARPVRDVAVEILVQAGWISPADVARLGPPREADGE